MAGTQVPARLTLAWIEKYCPPTQAASVAALQQHVGVLSTDYANRNFEQMSRLDGAARYIETEWTAKGLVVESQKFIAQGSSFRNLIAGLGPDTRDVVVIGAHYDVAGTQPEADDNANGVAGLIELARLLKNAQLTTQVEMVAYTNEEPTFFRTPSMGSAVHAKALKASGKRESLRLSLECIGYFSHLNFAHDGFVGMMVTDTAFYWNNAHHTPENTADRLDYVRMGKVVDGVHRTVLAQAGAAATHLAGDNAQRAP